MAYVFDRPADPVSVRLADGKDYRLFYTHRQLRKIREDYGIDLWKMTGLETVDQDRLPDILARGLKMFNAELAENIEAVEDLMDVASYPYVLAKIIHAATGHDITKNAQSSQKENAVETTTAENSTGCNTGRSDDTTSD